MPEIGDALDHFRNTFEMRKKLISRKLKGGSNLSGFPTDMFYMNENRFIIIMCHLHETDGTFGYFYMQMDEEKAIKHYNRIKENFTAEGGKDSVLYLDGCKVVHNPELKIPSVSLYLQDKMHGMSGDELEDLIHAAMSEIWDRKHKKVVKPEPGISEEFNPFL